MMVDDEPIILETLQMFLEDAGYDNFITTTEPKRALNMVVLKKPDVVLLDVMMPEITGLDILEQMRSKEALKHIPTIILTSATDPDAPAASSARSRAWTSPVYDQVSARLPARTGAVVTMAGGRSRGPSSAAGPPQASAARTIRDLMGGGSNVLRGPPRVRGKS